MTAAEAKFRAGDLPGCLAELQNDVRGNPSDAKLRVFLAQLLMVLGDWDRAVTQLSLVGEMDAGALPMVHAYAQRDPVRATAQHLFFAASARRWCSATRSPGSRRSSQALARCGQGRTEQAARAARPRRWKPHRQRPGTLNGIAVRLDRGCGLASRPDARGVAERRVLLGAVPSHSADRHRAARGCARSRLAAGAVHLGERWRGDGLDPDALSGQRGCRRRRAAPVAQDRVDCPSATKRSPASANACWRPAPRRHRFSRCARSCWNAAGT